MLDEWAPESEARPESRRIYRVGWLFAKDKASVIWHTPEPIRQEAPETGSSKSVPSVPRWWSSTGGIS